MPGSGWGPPALPAPTAPRNAHSLLLDDTASFEAATAAVPFSAMNPMQQLTGARAPEDEPGADVGSTPPPATVVGGAVRALRSLYQSRHNASGGAVPSGKVPAAAQQRVSFVGGTRIVAPVQPLTRAASTRLLQRAASARQLQEPRVGGSRQRASFTPAGAAGE